MGIYRGISKIIPRKSREKLQVLIKATDMMVPAEQLIGFFIAFTIGVALALAFFLGKFLGWNPILTFIVSTLVILTTLYLLALLSASAKTKMVEELLPDALQLMASNLRAGIGVEKSLLLAARPEFGPLKDEIEKVGKEVATGKDVGHALLDMSKNIRSKQLERVVKLIIAGLRSGGKLATLLENSAEDLREQRLLKEKIRSNVQMYLIFIFVAAGIGSPLLFALSLFLVKVIIANFSSIDIPTTAAGAVPIVIKEVQISTSFLLKYILISLTTTSILSSFTLGMISRGKAKEGAKFILILVTLSLGLFFLVGFVLNRVLGGFFTL